MAFLTKYGTAWGALPMTGGSIIWVAPAASYQVDGRTYSASDDNDGLSPERAKLTISGGFAATTASVGDVVALLPGTHTVATTSVAWNKAGVSLIGLPYYPDQHTRNRAAAMFSRPKTIVTTSIAADQAINVTAADAMFVNIVMRPITGAAFMDFTTAADRLSIRDCHIDLKTPVGAANTAGVVATGATQAPTYISFVNCTMEEDNGGTSQSFAVDVGAAAPFLIDSCTIWKDGNTASTAAWDVAIQIRDNAWGLVRDCDVFVCTSAAGGKITKAFNGVDMTVAESINFSRNYSAVSVTKLFDDFGAGDCSIANNYIATVAGGTGGTLITATT